jgi:aspartyl-tRNA(Asn)/glutamyl-tRNA(Gln) amidotransferase subunit C
MSLNLQDVQRVAKLARIAVSDDEAQAYQQQINGIFALVTAMQAVDTEGIAPMAHAQDVHQRLREDLVTEYNQRTVFQALAPQAADGLYFVPQVID